MIVLFAIGLLQHHRESFRAQADSEKNSADDLRWIRSQFRRRMTASSLIAVIGVLFLIDSFVVDIRWSVLLVGVIVLLLPVLFCLAMVDFYRTQQRLRPSIRQAVDARQALYDEADRVMIERRRRQSAEGSKGENDSGIDPENGDGNDDGETGERAGEATPD